MAKRRSPPLDSGRLFDPGDDDMHVSGFAPPPSLPEAGFAFPEGLPADMQAVLDMARGHWKESNSNIYFEEIDEPGLDYLLRHPHVQQLIRDIRLSRLQPLFDKHCHRFLLAPASSYSAKNKGKLHDCHTHGLLVHNARVYQATLQEFDSYQENGDPLDCDRHDIVKATFIHDFGKIGQYRRVGQTHRWAYRDFSHHVDQHDLTLDLIDEEIGISRLGLKLRNVINWQRMEARRIIQEKHIQDGRDLILALSIGDMKAVRESEMPGRQWQEQHHCSGCGNRLKLVIPFDIDDDDLVEEPTYRCAHHGPQCPRPVRTDAQQIIDELRTTFPAWLKEAFPMPALS